MDRGYFKATIEESELESTTIHEIGTLNWLLLDGSCSGWMKHIALILCKFVCVTKKWTF